MESREVRARTAEEAVQRGLEELGVGREEVDVVVVREGRSGVFGLGAEEAIVRLTLKEKANEAAEPEGPEPGNIAEPTENVAAVATAVLQRLLDLMDVPGEIDVVPQPAPAEDTDAPASVALNIEGEDLGILIGRRGQTLAALQYIVRILVGRQVKTWTPVVIDVEGYKQRRYEALRTFARQMAERVKARGAPFTLEPMPPYERRIIHLTLANSPDVMTESVGQDEERKVVIRPKPRRR